MKNKRSRFAPLSLVRRENYSSAEFRPIVFHPSRSPKKIRHAGRASKVWSCRLIILAAICIATTFSTSFAKTGISDRTFGSNGKIITSFGGSINPGSVLVQPDGKIVVCGTIGESYQPEARFVLARYEANGSPDLLFGNNGVVSTAIGALRECVLQPDGKIVAVGGYQRFQSWTVAVARYKANGSLDADFGGTGIITPQISGSDFATSVLAQPDGKLVVAGSSENGRLFIARFNPTGTFDARFAANGIFLSSSPYLLGEANKIIMQPDAKLVVATRQDGFARLTRFFSSGRIDTSFGSDGSISFGTGGYLSSIKIQPDGKLVVGENTNNQGPNYIIIKRFNTDGSNDTTFGSAGTVAIYSFMGREYETAALSDLAIQPNGRIVIAGYALYKVNSVFLYDFALARFNGDGTLDESFGRAGVTVSDFGGSDIASAVNIGSDGKIVVAGTNRSSQDFDLLVARYIGLDSVKCDFDGDGKSDISVYRPADGNWYLLRSATSTFSAVHFGTAEDQPVPADYDGDLKTDIAVYRPSTGVWYRINSSNSVVSTLSFGLSTDIPTPSDYDGDGRADMGVFRPSDGTWYRINSLNNQLSAVRFGLAGDRPVPGDYDGDGKADFAVWRTSTGTWYYDLSQTNSLKSERIDYYEGDRGVPSDFDGDGKSDTAFWRNANGNWYGLRSSTGSGIFAHWGAAGDFPVPADYDSDGKDDFAVWRPSTGSWWITLSSTGSTYNYNFGAAGDIPLQSAFVR
jgi:uncharacterized delta-60 repeat protein